MQKQEGFLAGVRGNRLYHQRWLPEGGTKAGLVVAHGLAEHSGRYGNLIDRFVPKGYAVYGIDHVGHGKSTGQRLYVERFGDYADSLSGFLDSVRELQPGKPLFLVGHSMGGLIAALTLLDQQGGLSGAVLSGPAIKAPGDLPPAVLRIGRLLSRLCPRLGLVPVSAEGVSRDPRVVEAYINDPLVSRGRITARLGMEILAAMAQVRREAARITLPLLIVQGGADRLVDPAGARLFYDAVASADKRLILYEGLYHEVFNEPERHRVLTDVEQWLEAHLNREQGG
ncbi:MAG: lysophospholipase [Deltaproteobacteria bacterium]|nr:lysophospholipase [Deltaproteobacteria bacterium]